MTAGKPARDGGGGIFGRSKPSARVHYSIQEIAIDRYFSLSFYTFAWTSVLCLSNRFHLIFGFFFFFTIERSPPIEEVIQSGVVPRFVQFLTREDFPQLQVLLSSCTFGYIFIL